MATRPGHPAPHLTSKNQFQRARKETPGDRGTPGDPARQPGHGHTPGLKSIQETGHHVGQRQPSAPMKDQG